MFQHADALFMAEGVSAVWESEDRFATPEAVVWDPERRQFYVSNYDAMRTGARSGGQTISRVGPVGELLDAEWVGGLFNPTGMVLHGDRLFIVDRKAVTEVDAASGAVIHRRELPAGGFANDITVAPNGDLYVTDSQLNRIYKVTGDEVSVWLEDPALQDPNGLCTDGTYLYVGNNGDGCVKKVALASREISTLARLSSGIIDGITFDRRGDLLVSHWQGRVFRITPDGRIDKLIDTSVQGQYLADFGYQAEEDRVIAPTFYGNQLAAFDLSN